MNYDKQDMLYRRDNFINNSQFTEWARLYSCTAWYTIKENLIWLKSYDTIVGCYDVKNACVISYGRYSATTYQHFAKFRRRIWEIYRPTERPWEISEVNLKAEDFFGCYGGLWK